MRKYKVSRQKKVQILPDVELVANEERIVFSISYERKIFEQDTTTSIKSYISRDLRRQSEEREDMCNKEKL